MKQEILFFSFAIVFFVLFLISPSFFIQYWYVTAVILSLMAYLFSRLVLHGILIRKYQKELMKLQELRKDIQNSYFVEGTIDDDTFREFDTDIDQRISTLKSKLESKKLKKVTGK